MPQQTLSDAQLRQRGLAGLAELARLDDRTGSINAVAARALDLVGSMLDADHAAVCAIEGDQTIEWLAQRRLERLIAASSDLRPSELSWVRRPLELPAVGADVTGSSARGSPAPGVGSLTGAFGAVSFWANSTGATATGIAAARSRLCVRAGAKRPPLIRCDAPSYPSYGGLVVR